MAKRYWLFKSEPDSFSINDLADLPNQTTSWEGVRNYQSRSSLRDDVQVGDCVFFHHSSANPPGLAGTCEITRAGYPDATACDPAGKYFDSKSTDENPRWYTVDVKLVEKFAELIPLSTQKETPGLENMMVGQRGSRLSIQPVTADQWQVVMRLAKCLFQK